MKTYLFLFPLLCLSFLSKAQSDTTNLFYENEAIYLYQIKLGAYQGSVNFSQFDDVKDLGKISVVSIDEEIYNPLSDTTFVYLGVYIGNAAYAALQEVKRRGYKDAYLEMNSYDLNHSTGKNITHAIQLGAFLVPQFQWADKIDHTFYISYEEGLFKIFSDLYDPSITSLEEIAAMKSFAQKLGFQAFGRRFRKQVVVKE